MMSEKTQNPNVLDPGRLHPHKRSMSSCTCVLYLALIAVVLIVIRFFTVTIYTMVENAQSPHKAIYQNVTSMAEVKNRANVVQPLVGEGQKFDVAATVWVRDSVYDGKEGWSDGIRKERALFSDLVFRNLTLKDKNKYTSVDFQLPLSIFREEYLTNYDVRASFALIPHQPSLLDQAVNFSSWYDPDSITVPPVRTWPFPLGNTSTGERAFEDEAIDSFGISIPMIQFHGIHSKCSNQSRTDSSSYKDDLEDDESQDDVEEDRMKRKTVSSKYPSSLPRTTIREPALKSHPYLVTRTQIRVIDETRLYNRQSYNKAHKLLKSNSCGQSNLIKFKFSPSYYMCRVGWTFSEHGNFETRLELAIGNADGKDDGLREWAYAPFLTTLKGAAGVKDILPLPVNREKCSFDEDSETDIGKEPDSIPIEWKLSFSGRTPAKHAMAKFLLVPPFTVFNHTQSDFEMQQNHRVSELLNGVVGHRFYQDAHPRRVLLLHTLGTTVLQYTRVLFDAHYWYTRTTTYSLSGIGYLMISLGDIMETTVMISLGDIMETTVIYFPEYDAFWSWLIGCLLIWITTPISFLQLKAITRVEFGWINGGNSWIPRASFAPPTHRERASERADASLHWKKKSAIFFSFLIFFHFFSPENYYLLSPRHALRPNQSSWVKYAQTLNNSLGMSGIIFQWMLNRKLGVFSGRYKISMWILVVQCLTMLCELMPMVVGRQDLREGLSLRDGLCYLTVAADAWLAWRLPSPKQDEEDDSTQ